MAVIKNLLQQITDPVLRERLTEEVNRLSKNKKFGLVFEEHVPECTPLYSVPIKQGSFVARKTGKMNNIYIVKEIDGETATCIDKITLEIEAIPLSEIVSVAQFGEPIFPSLEPIDKVLNAADDSLWHTIIEADNYHALQLLEYLYEGKVDCIYIDTACGSGGFLSIAIEKLRQQINELYKNRGFSKDRLNSLLKDYADKYIYGCDIDPLLYRISKSYMAIVGDGKSNIYNFDSLEPYSKLNSNFKSRIKPGAVDIITTNPPFGTHIKDTRKSVLEQYELGHKLVDGVPQKEILDGQDPDKLFVERDIYYLKEATNTSDGGRMVIVLPKQNLSGAQEESVEFRKWLLKKVQIIAVIDLPREAFQPHTGTKTSLVFLKKVKNIPDDYPIFMAVSEAVGHDRRGNPLYKKDASGMNLKDENGNPVIWNDLPEILSQWKRYSLTGSVQELPDEEGKVPSCFVISSKQIMEDASRRIDAWYWDPNKNNLAKQIEESVGEEVREIVRLGDLVVEHGIFYPGRHKRNYVESSDNSVPFYSGTQILQIRPFDLQYQPKDYKPAAKHFVEKDWILITRSGSTGRVVMVTESMAGSMVSEHVIRVICDETLIDPYYVYAFLATDGIGKILLEKGIYASVVDHITPDFVATIPIPRLSPEKEKIIANRVREAETKRDEANRAFLEERNAIEQIMYSNMKKDS